MSPTSCRCSTPRHGGCDRPGVVEVRERADPWRGSGLGQMSGSGGARSGLASHRIAPAVLSGAAAGHDRVRDGTGWGHRALGHGHPSTSTSASSGPPPADSVSFACLVIRTLVGDTSPLPRRSRRGRCVVWFPAVSRLGNGAQTLTSQPVGTRKVPSLIRTGRLRSVASRPPPAYQPGGLPGSLPDFSVGCVVLGRDSRLDAFSGSPIRT